MSSAELNNNEVLSPRVIQAFHALALAHGLAADDYELVTRPVSGAGDNNYGDVYQVKVTSKRQPTTVKPLIAILKVAPKNPARRQHMRIVDFYHREVFMYERVFHEYRQLSGAPSGARPAVTPHLLHSSLAEGDEFIICEDLTQSAYAQNSRAKMPTYELVAAALRALAQLHGMSFVLQSQKPAVFAALVASMNDNLFSAEMEEVSVEFGKKYVRRTRELIEEDLDSGRGEPHKSLEMIEFVQHLEDNFKAECFRCVKGAQSAPYAVICHGDFWNNNILYKFQGSADDVVSAKLIDFQMSRYAAPVLDVVHYLFACTEQDLRDAHLPAFLNIYYDTLCGVIETFGPLTASSIYPRSIYDAQLKEFGVYGFCMAAFAIPFFITSNDEVPDLDEVAEAISDLDAPTTTSTTSTAATTTTTTAANGCPSSSADDNAAEKTLKCRELVDEYEMLTERSLPIFKRRMIGIVEDMLKYQLFEQNGTILV